MDYQTEESILINYLDRWFSNLSQIERNDFADDFPSAYESLKWIKFNEPDYNRAFMGQAYAFKFHLSRTDQLRLALHHLNAVSPVFLDDTSRVLDVGAGTGAGMMAVMSHWASEPRLGCSCKMYAFEPSNPMREVARSLLRVYHEQCYNTSTFEWMLRNLDFYQCASFCEANKQKKIFDLIVFNHLFWIIPESQRNPVLSAVKSMISMLKTGGHLLMVIPNEPTPKRIFGDWLLANLETYGMRRVVLDIPNAVGVTKVDWPYKPGYPPVSFAPYKKSPGLIRLMKKIQRECEENLGCSPFGINFGDNEDDYPFFGFWGRRKDDHNLTPMVNILVKL